MSSGQQGARHPTGLQYSPLEQTGFVWQRVWGERFRETQVGSPVGSSRTVINTFGVTVVSQEDHLHGVCSFILLVSTVS